MTRSALLVLAGLFAAGVSGCAHARTTDEFPSVYGPAAAGAAWCPPAGPAAAEPPAFVPPAPYPTAVQVPVQPTTTTTTTTAPAPPPVVPGPR